LVIYKHLTISINNPPKCGEETTCPIKCRCTEGVVDCRDLGLTTVPNSNVKYILLYGSETWRETASSIKALQVFLNHCLRTILGVRWLDTISNKELWRKTKQQPINLDVVDIEILKCLKDMDRSLLPQFAKTGRD
jgi:hypothetical protein